MSLARKLSSLSGKLFMARGGKDQVNVEQFYSKNNKLKAKHDVAMKKLSEKYALSNNKHEVGDVVSDSVGSISVERITWDYFLGSDLPYCLYHGVMLTKKLMPYKSGERRTVSQRDIKGGK